MLYCHSYIIFSFHNLVEQTDKVVSIKRWSEGQHLVQHTAQSLEQSISDSACISHNNITDLASNMFQTLLYSK